MDYNISDKDQVRGRYIYNKWSTLDMGAQLGLFYTPFRAAVSPGFAERISHLLASDSETSFGWDLRERLRISRRPAARWEIPESGCISQPNDHGTWRLDVGPDPNAPQYGIQNNYQAVDNVSFVKGNHR